MEILKKKIPYRFLVCEIAPYKRHPVYGNTVREMLQELDG